jgi:hypothetical protein
MVLKRLHNPLDVILTCVRWYVARESICIARATRSATRSIFGCVPIVTSPRRRRYLERSIDQSHEPKTVTFDQSGSNLAAPDALGPSHPEIVNAE